MRSRRLYRPPWLYITLAIYFVLFSVWWQTGLQSIPKITLYVMFPILACTFPKLGIGVALFWLFDALFEFAGSSDPFQDCAILAIAFVVAAAIILCWHRCRHLDQRDLSWWPTDRQAVSIAFLFLLLGWTSISIVDWLRETSFSNSPTFVNSVAKDKAPSVRIGLALSGGGYRAGLLHAGVLSALEEMSVPVEVISSVSGASIIGSFYATGGTPEQFVDRVVGGLFNLEREALRINNILCLIRIPVGERSVQIFSVSSKCSRTELQANLVRRILLGNVRAKDGSFKGRPELMLATTDIASSRMVGITPHGFVNIWLRPPLDRLTFANPAMLGDAKHQAAFFPTHLAHLPDQELLAELVAASGAFPGALPAYRLKAPYTVRGYPPSSFEYLLADGGLTDNSGIVLLDAAQLIAKEAKAYIADPVPERTQNPPNTWNMSRWDIDLILASDGSALNPETVPKGAFDEFVRAMDVMNATTGGKEMFATREFIKQPRPPVLLLSPRTFSLNPPPPRGHVVSLQFGTPADWSLSKDMGQDLPPMGFAAIEKDTLSFIVANMVPKYQLEAGAILAKLANAGAITDDGVTEEAAFTSDGRLGPEKGSQLERLYNLIQLELDRRLRAFIATPTLRDKIDRETAESIQLLGKYLVRLNKRYLTCLLKRIELTKQGAEGETIPKCNPVQGTVSAAVLR